MSEQTLPVLAVTVVEAAHMLGVSRVMIYRLMERGELRTVTIGRNRRVPIVEIERLAGVDGDGGL